jgi:hypothetical protein
MSRGSRGFWSYGSDGWMGKGGFVAAVERFIGDCG